MYLSRISLSPETGGDARFWKMFESPYRLHQAVWDLFADDPDRRRDFLYRLDREGGRPRVFSLSERQPRATEGLWRVESQEFRPVLQAGERLRFSLRANPVVTRNGKRHDVVMEAKRLLGERGVPKAAWPAQAELAQEAGAVWLTGRAHKHGFAVEPGSVRVDGYEIHQFSKAGGGDVRFATCDFEGLLTVTDVETFLAALRNGIGPAKGFGCGLMLVRRA